MEERGRDPFGLFDGASVKWDRSKEEVWAAMQEEIEEKGPGRVISIGKRRRLLAVAALVVLLLGVPSLMRFYTREHVSMKGEHIEVNLPDGSLISMNAESSIKFHPFWWRFNREVQLEGEAFFEVKPGSSFEVRSELAITEVVGTSFNIISRDERYEVTCFTGKVKVRSSVSDSELLLMPDQRASLLTGGTLLLQEINSTGQTISWINNQFFFTAVPLEQVFEEVERQFDIKIRSEIPEGLVYTGNFTIEKDAESALNIICKPFGIKFEALAEKVYLISENE